MSSRIIAGDCIEAMAELEEASVDAIVTDPPYGLEFMGREWDAPWKTGDGFRRGRNAADAERDDVFGRTTRRSPEYRAGAGFQAWSEQWATEALRVLKPGGHLLAFGGTRTYHRLACAIEDAGFEIRDCLAWMYGSGFPKSHDVSKAIDAAAGAEREVKGLGGRSGRVRRAMAGDFAGEWDATAPATPEAAEWEGWGTALKPAHEPIVLARKPLVGTVAANVLEHGTGGLNVDGCRVGIDESERATIDTRSGGSGGGRDGFLGDVDRESGERFTSHDAGRWPANVVLDPEAAAMLDEQSGELTSGKLTAENQRNGGFAGTVNAYGTAAAGGTGEYEANAGGASRFFYCAKANGAERNAGLEGFDPQFAPTMNNGIGAKEHDPETATRKANVHPTVKPIALMRWLIRLVTPPGGLVLDPFTGSGTTGCAAALEGFEFVGIEREAEYRAIAEARIAFWAEHEGAQETDKILAGDRKRKAVAETGQGALDLGI